MGIIKKYARETVVDIYIAFALAIFIKCVLFHYFCYGYVAVSSLWTSPMDFFSFYISKLVPALLIASFVFIFKKQWWTIIISLLIDVWMVANMVYFRSYGFFLDVDAISMVGNLSGFTNSILAYINWKTMFFVLITIFYAILVFFSKPKRINYSFFVLCLCLAFLFYGLDLLFYTGKVFSSNEKRISQVKKIAEGRIPSTMSFYIESSSIIHYVPIMFIFQKYRTDYLDSFCAGVEFSEEEQKTIDSLFRLDASSDTAKTNLIVILVESLESWTLQFKDENGDYVAPNMQKLIDADSVLYCSRIKSQALYGNSGDGQMLVNTGMLPLQTGAACMLFGKNKYPNFAHYYQNATNVNPLNSNVWNQHEMNVCYNYNDYVFPECRKVNDAEIFNMAYENIITKKGLFCSQVITISTHVPFENVAEINLLFKNDMPKNLRGYLNCVHYTDSCIGDFLNKLEIASLLSSSTVVITGDHTVFKKSLLDEFAPFAQKYNYPIPQDESFCPLIIISPVVCKKMIVSDICYQMDIFPTILHCIGADDYYWKGFGVNLLDSAARYNRKITEEEAYILSDKMIRSDWFSN
ncbi:MAG: sulfatase-like hydrolase/transferase [Salinivirgaceae bacterium]|nr:sulfatase-like hydrolase/transferase [Salinivirgaceae bacterium]